MDAIGLGAVITASTGVICCAGSLVAAFKRSGESVLAEVEWESFRLERTRRNSARLEREYYGQVMSPSLFKYDDPDEAEMQLWEPELLEKPASYWRKLDVVRPVEGLMSQDYR